MKTLNTVYSFGKNDWAFTFKLKDFVLDSNGMDFNIDDATTYSIIGMGPNYMGDERLEARNQNNSIMHESNDPFQIIICRDKNKTLIFCNRAGQTWQSALIQDCQEQPAQQTP